MLNKLSEHSDNRGILRVLNLKDVPFKIKRIFIVSNVPSYTTRGQHGHYKEEQYVICLKGPIRFILKNKDGIEEKILRVGDTIYIPKLTWTEQVYLGDDCILLVLCSTDYDPDDYIRDEGFLTNEN